MNAPASIQEPTLNDVILVVQQGFTRVEGRLDAVDMRLDAVESRFQEVETGMHEINRRVGKLEVRVEDMNETLTGLAEAFDKDAETLVMHEERIAALEQ